MSVSKRDFFTFVWTISSSYFAADAARLQRYIPTVLVARFRCALLTARIKRRPLPKFGSGGSLRQTSVRYTHPFTSRNAVIYIRSLTICPFELIMMMSLLSAVKTKRERRRGGRRGEFLDCHTRSENK